MQSIDVDSQRAAVTSATPVTILTAPATGFKRTAVALRFTNLDSSVATAILSKDINGTAIEVARRVGIAVATDGGLWDDVITLDKRMVIKATESLKMALGGAGSASVVVEFFQSTDDA